MSRGVEQRRTVAVADALEIAIGRPPRISAVAPVTLVGAGEIDAGAVLGLVLVEHGVALVVTGLADQPAEDPPMVGRVGDAGVRVLAVQGQDVVVGNGPPMHVAVALARPPLEAGEEPLDAGPVAVDDVARRGGGVGESAALRRRTGTRSSAPVRRNTSDSSASRYCGNPLSVFRMIEGSERLQPKPNGPLPAPESYDRDSCGPKPERPGLAMTGTAIEAVPVTGLAVNFSPIPRMAPPPLGRAMAGG